MLWLKVIYCFCRVPSMHSIEIQIHLRPALFFYFDSCLLPVCLFGFDLCYSQLWPWILPLLPLPLWPTALTLACFMDILLPLILLPLQIWSLCMTLERVNSSPGLRLTPVPGITFNWQWFRVQVRIKFTLNTSKLYYLQFLMTQLNRNCLLMLNTV